jgi:azurin
MNLLPFAFCLLTFVQAPPPRILLDQPLRAVEYQLDRLTSDELSRLERKDDDARYRPVYVALLTRRGLPRQFRDEALAALTKLDKTSATRVLLEVLAKVPIDDAFTAEKLLALLLNQPMDTLRQQRGQLEQAIDRPSPPLVLRGAYGALLVADGAPDAAWQAALKRDGHLVELLRSVAHLPAAGSTNALGDQLFKPISALVDERKDAGTRAEALTALAWTRRDAATFGILAREVVNGASEDTRVAAARSLLLIPEGAWPKAIEPLARAIIAWVGETTPDRRIEPAMLDVIHLGEKLAAALPPEAARAVRRELRSLGVQVVRIEALPEQLLFDVKWFVVEAGKPVQIVLSNPDAMPHNLVVSQPGSLTEVASLGGGMPLSTDPGVKPYVPNTPLVLHATRLLQSGDTERLGFRAPATPGEYIFVCTFPGHWLRMYGVMLVVPDLEAWEATPTVPTDPMTRAPFTSRWNQK